MLLVCTGMYWYVTRMLLVCYSYVTRMLLVCTLMLFVCTRMLLVCTRVVHGFSHDPEHKTTTAKTLTRRAQLLFVTHRITYVTKRYLERVFHKNNYDTDFTD